MNRNDIDKQAEREAKALRKQGRYYKPKRIRYQDNYSKIVFDRLFRSR